MGCLSPRCSRASTLDLRWWHCWVRRCSVLALHCPQCQALAVPTHTAHDADANVADAQLLRLRAHRRPAEHTYRKRCYRQHIPGASHTVVLRVIGYTAAIVSWAALMIFAIPAVWYKAGLGIHSDWIPVVWAALSFKWAVLIIYYAGIYDKPRMEDVYEQPLLHSGSIQDL
eukprot:m.28525 g.28525  ORF g.28525 m.28525 type:complete len:171 (-) comp4967_c0_seq1:504-1016(-)